MKKMFPWLITMLLSITLIALAAFLIVKPGTSPAGGDASAKKTEAAHKLSADEIVKLTSVIDGIKTNLSDPSYILSINFAFQLNNEKAKAAFDKVAEYKVKPIIIKTLAEKKPEELTGAKGKDQLCTELLNKIDQVLPEGSLSQIEVTDFVMSAI
ncbi:flagellar basal body protein FliL [Paenibacillus yonginensis]|uniref:Flagellar protein FliL n=1 Tax=Paenibacillus yonginensis TaxID=1462996 RepID=A0A1B1MXX5_9BACL|nr:flagellar basal body-associated FliL family protein [Paenibacillus yonginensis]ANS74007.1 flagellar basal body protein FliL [Paenibacillus yonginensis]